MRKSLGSVTYPVKAEAAAVYGEARYICPSLWPILPGKFLFVVDTQICMNQTKKQVKNHKQHNPKHESDNY